MVAHALVASVALLARLLAAASARETRPGPVVVHPAAPGEAASPDDEVRVNGAPVFLYGPISFRQGSSERIVGRPVSPIGFCVFDADGSAEVEVRLLDGLRRAGLKCRSVVVRPLARGIRPRVRDGRLRFRVPGPGDPRIRANGWVKGVSVR